MLNNPTQVKLIRVEEKRFRVIPVYFPGESNQKYSEKLNQDIDVRDDNDEDLGGWINCEDGVPCQTNLPVFEESKTAEGVEPSEDPELKKFTHFINVPLNLKPFQDSLRKLQLEITNNFGAKFKEYFVPAEKSHLTMLMLKLDTEEKINRVNQLKDEIEKEIKNAAGKQSIVLEIGNLEMFHQVNKKTGEKTARVLYASLKDNKGLKVVKEIIHNVTSLLIREKVLVKEDFSHMKLNDVTRKYELDQMHVTILKNPDNKLKHAELEKLAQDYKRFGFKEVTLERIDISSMKEFEDNGFYKPLQRFNLKC